MTKKAGNVVTRFAPSPTGFLHVGGIRTALFSYLFARQNGGKFILRIEDTDKERNKEEYDKGITDSFKWFGLPYNELYRQSERTHIYKDYLKKIIDAGHAYISKEEIKEEGDRPEVIRFKNPNKKIAFDDLVRGRVEFDTTDLGDFVIARSLEEPLYHLAVVVDDFEMGITHVIRAEEHISNTPRQILIQEALGFSRPIYAHLPLILASDKSKLSKRKHGATVSLPYYIEHGYLPEAIINYLALLGWNPGNDQEIFTIEELVKLFDISKVQKGGAVFNEEKLRWFNKEYMKKMPVGDLHKRIKEIISKKFSVEDEDVRKLAPVLLERSSTFGDIEAMIQSGELDYFFIEPEYAPEMLVWKGKGTLESLRPKLESVVTYIRAITDADYTSEAVKNALWDYATKEGRGEVLWATRFALSGKEKSPDPFVLASLLGKTKTIERLQNAIKKAGA